MPKGSLRKPMSNSWCLVREGGLCSAPVVHYLIFMIIFISNITGFALGTSTVTFFGFSLSDDSPILLFLLPGVLILLSVNAEPSRRLFSSFSRPQIHLLIFLTLAPNGCPLAVASHRPLVSCVALVPCRSGVSHVPCAIFPCALWGD